MSYSGRWWSTRLQGPQQVTVELVVGKKVIKYLDEYKLQEQELDVYCNILFGGGELTEEDINTNTK